MKIKMIFLLLGLLIFGDASQVLAQDPGPYLGISISGQFLAPSQGEDQAGTFNLNYRSAPSGSVVLGWELTPGSNLGEGRVELEYSHRSNRFDTAEFTDGEVPAGGDLTADSLLINTFGVYRSKSQWTPYLGIGLGAARITAKDLTVTGQPLANDDAVVFAYQIGGGVDLQLSPAWTLDFGYRLFSTTKAKLTEANGDEFETGYLSHNLLVGLRFGF